MALVAFTPSASITLTVTTAQGNASPGGNGHYFRLCNGGAGAVYLAFYEPGGTVPTIAAATAYLLPAGAIEIVSVATDVTRIAYAGDATGTTLNVTRGEGQ